MTAKVQNITVSIPRDLIIIADKVAREKRISRSNLVANCLKELAARQLQEQLEEGYTAMAKEHKRFTDMTIASVHEVLPEWE
jgi:metal-responsive CopG/Arc/MetJ family transcriptional regulator